MRAHDRGGFAGQVRIPLVVEDGPMHRPGLGIFQWRIRPLRCQLADKCVFWQVSTPPLVRVLMHKLPTGVVAVAAAAAVAAVVAAAVQLLLLPPPLLFPHFLRLRKPEGSILARAHESWQGCAPLRLQGLVGLVNIFRIAIMR